MKLRKTAFKFVHTDGIQSKVGAAKGMAGYDWAAGFFICYPELSLS
jgi:hypothetical protein